MYFAVGVHRRSERVLIVIVYNTTMVVLGFSINNAIQPLFRLLYRALRILLRLPLHVRSSTSSAFPFAHGGWWGGRRGGEQGRFFCPLSILVLYRWRRPPRYQECSKSTRPFLISDAFFPPCGGPDGRVVSTVTQRRCEPWTCRS